MLPSGAFQDLGGTLPGHPTQGRGGQPSTHHWLRGRPLQGSLSSGMGSPGRVAGACLGKQQAAVWAEGPQDVVQLAVRLSRRTADRISLLRRPLGCLTCRETVNLAGHRNLVTNKTLLEDGDMVTFQAEGAARGPMWKAGVHGLSTCGLAHGSQPFAGGSWATASLSALC